jgi:hypothetical protein
MTLDELREAEMQAREALREALYHWRDTSLALEREECARLCDTYGVDFCAIKIRERNG